MKEERKRIFISELPETASEDAIRDAFNQYGLVHNIEIKERKELGPKNSSLFFSYVNLDIDQKELQKCFKDFANGKWLGRYVMLQVARESFLDRIKREREESNPDQNQYISDKKEDKSSSLTVESVKAVVNELEVQNKKEKYNEHRKVIQKSPVKEKNISISEENLEDIDYIIKDNKRKSHHEASKIESVGKEPIFIQDSKHKTNLNTSNPANQKRLDSLKLLKQNYQQQKTLIKAALSNVDQPNNKKVNFDSDNIHISSPSKQQKLNDTSSTNKSLFNDQSEDEEDNFEANFAIKEQFLGERGQKLLELQSRYKNDKRFQLDSRFVNDEIQNEPEDIENSLEEEKKKQLEILEGILGNKSFIKTKRTAENTKKMLRFNPSQPEHSKFEIPKETKEKNQKEEKAVNEKKLEETDTPIVSKEVFYKVNENIKNSLHKNEGFSLLDTFGVAEEKEEGNEEGVIKAKPSKSFRGLNETNPFTYDSSEDEDETKDVMNQEGFNKSQESKFLWTERLFFSEDDYRLQEGFDFIQKMKHDDKDFSKLRRELRNVVRAKVRNNLAKKKPFKRKLGGSRMKKVMRIKKAFKK